MTIHLYGYWLVITVELFEIIERLSFGAGLGLGAFNRGEFTF